MANIYMISVIDNNVEAGDYQSNLPVIATTNKDRAVRLFKKKVADVHNEYFGLESKEDAEEGIEFWTPRKIEVDINSLTEDSCIMQSADVEETGFEIYVALSVVPAS